MPKLIYTPEGAEEPREFDYDLGKMSLPDVEFVEDRLGVAWGVFRTRVGPWHSANRALLYLLLRREHSGLKWDELEPLPDEIVFDIDDATLRDFVVSILTREAAGEELVAEERHLIDLWAEKHPDDPIAIPNPDDDDDDASAGAGSGAAGQESDPKA